jgi:nucleotide-binding universal stress UspA family protein
MREPALVSGMPQPLVADDHLTGRNVLLATDFSECSARALGYALGVASRYGSQLYLFHCIDPTPYYLVEPDAVQAACDDARRELEQLVSNLRREGRIENVELKVVVKAGDFAVILPQAIEELGLGLIVVGTHGRTGWKKLALGSFAERVVDNVSCPVLCVSPSTERTRIKQFGPENILLASDGSGRSQLAKSLAFSLARKYHCRLTTVDVLENQSGRVLAKVSQFEWHERDGRDTTFDSPLTRQLPTEAGTQSDLILRTADRTAADLIVLAVPETHRFADRFLPTSSYQVICGAACPVLTVRAR